MRIRVGTDVHVIQRGRKVSGLTSWMSADLLAFSLRGRALQRGHAEMRLELMGTTTVIEARVRILTVEFVGTSGSCNYTARIMEIERGDRMRLDGWLEERSQLTASFSRSASTSRGRRGGLGGALRSGLEKGRSAEDADSEGAADPVLVPTTTLSPDGSTLVVAWANWRSVTASWESSLREGSLEAWIERTHPPLGYDLIVQLCLPDGSVRATMGRVTNSGGSNLTVSVTLKDKVRDALRGV